MSNSIQPGRPTSTDASDRDIGHWVAGIFYVNRENPHLLVPKRLGAGWTFNYAHPIARLLTVGLSVLLGLIVATALVLPHVLH
jgi:uncharacterized membrane protein